MADDKVSTTEANFVELKYEVLLSNKSSPFTPVKLRDLVHSPSSSPAICPSLTGAEENTTFASPPVPAVQRRLLQMSARRTGDASAAGGSRLKNELSFGEDIESMESEEVEVLQDDHTEADMWEKVTARIPGLPNATSKKHYNPPPVFDPEISLGDVSIIDGIEEDVVRAAEHLSEDKSAATKLDVGPDVLADEEMVGPEDVATDFEKPGESAY